MVLIELVLSGATVCVDSPGASSGRGHGCACGWTNLGARPAATNATGAGDGRGNGVGDGDYSWGGSAFGDESLEGGGWGHQVGMGHWTGHHTVRLVPRIGAFAWC